MNEVGAELGTSLIAALKRARIEFVISVPDIVTSQHLLWPITDDPDFRLLRVCKEDEGFGIAAGLAVCAVRSVLLIQHTGLLDSINALRAVGVALEQPLCLLVGLQGRQAGAPPRTAADYGVRIVEPILDAMGIPYHLVETDNDATLVPSLVDRAYAESCPTVILL
jgi:sulfopyruvate decarboxylase TPP-binding subunit